MKTFFSALILLAMCSLATAEPTKPPDESALYFYKAKIVDVYDGDSVTADIDLGFYVWVHEEKLRLYGIDAPEVKGHEREIGLLSRDFLRSKILNKEVLIQTIRATDDRDKKEKWGRFLAVVWLDGMNINDLLVKEGYAIHKDYEKRN